MGLMPCSCATKRTASAKARSVSAAVAMAAVRKRACMNVRRSQLKVGATPVWVRQSTPRPTSWTLLQGWARWDKTHCSNKTPVSLIGSTRWLPTRMSWTSSNFLIKSMLVALSPRFKQRNKTKIRRLVLRWPRKRSTIGNCNQERGDSARTIAHRPWLTRKNKWSPRLGNRGVSK